MGSDMPDPAPTQAAPDVAPARAKPGLHRAEEAAGWCFVLWGFAFALIRDLGGNQPGFLEEGLGALAVGAPYSTLGLLAILGSRSDRPALMAFSSMPLLPMSMLSVVMFPLLLPAGFLFVRALIGLFDRRQQHLGRPEPFLSFVLPAMPVLAFGYLLFHEDPRSWERAGGGSHSTSDIVTLSESALSLGTAAVVVAVAVVWILRDPSPAPGQGG